MLRCIKVLFSFAKNRSHLPADRTTEAEKVALVKVKRDDPATFTPAQFQKLLHAGGAFMVRAENEFDAQPTGAKLDHPDHGSRANDREWETRCAGWTTSQPAIGIMARVILRAPAEPRDG
jgi:hypothetical protein